MYEQELDRYWKTVVNTIQDGVMIVDTHGYIVSVNLAFESITGYAKDEVIGKSCAVLKCSLFEMVRGQATQRWCKLFETGEMKRRRCTLVRKDGRIIQALKNASILYDSKGQVMGAVETIADITELVEKDNQIAAFRRELRSADGFHGIIGTSAAMERAYSMIENAAQSDAPVIIYGESGTGKELASNAIHEISERRRGPYVRVNCAALTESLLESELFGHVKGSFTGAFRDRKGRFELAHSGDLFLDEIADLPLSTQVKLLRVLEAKTIERVGDSRPVRVDVRIISATHRNLKKLVEKGLFRQDLYFRVNVIPIVLPPLRERKEDIPLLAASFFRKNQLKSGKAIQGISNEAMGLLMSHGWPGNVRELRNVVNQAVLLSEEGEIGSTDFCLEPAPFDLPGGSGTQEFDWDRGFDFLGHVEQEAEKIERRILTGALRAYRGNKSETARKLGITRKTLARKLEKFGLEE